MFGKKMGLDHEDGVRTKVLGELMQHMIGMHGGSKAPAVVVHKESNAVLPNPDGSEKHEPAGKIEAEGVLPGKSHHLDAESEHSVPEEHEEGDLFGRKKKGFSEYF